MRAIPFGEVYADQYNLLYGAKEYDAECDLLDFDSSQMAEYTRHWCTAVRLARNEPEQEARVEGTKDGDDIIVFSDQGRTKELLRRILGHAERSGGLWLGAEFGKGRRIVAKMLLQRLYPSSVGGMVGAGATLP